MIWTKSAIRAARKAELAPILIAQGYRLLPLKDGNYRILPDPDNPRAPADLIVKLNFWTWPGHDLDGNTIDFFVRVAGKSFHEAMRIILARHNFSDGGTVQHGYDSSEQNLREVRGNVPKTTR